MVTKPIYDKYNVLYYSKSKNEIEKTFELLYGMHESIQFNVKKDRNVFMLIIQTINLLSNMEKKSYEISLKNIEVLKNITLNDKDHQLLIMALDYQSNYDYVTAHSIYKKILNNSPKNRAVFYAIHMLEFNQNWQKQMLESSRTVLNSNFNKKDNYFGFVKGIEAFSLIENGYYEVGRKSAEIAISINPKDVYSIHALCHYFYETGKYQEGIEWILNCKENWENNKGMKIHIWWHLAIFYLFDLNFRKIENIINEYISDKEYENDLEDLDITSLLWRLNLLKGKENLDLSNLKNWNDYLYNNHFIFNDLHSIMAYILTEDNERLDTFVNIVRKRENNKLDINQLNLIYGFYYFGKETYQAATIKLKKVYNKSNFGGSNAQRDIIALTLFFAYIYSNQNEEAIRLISDNRAFKYDSKLKTLIMEYIKYEN